MDGLVPRLANIGTDNSDTKTVTLNIRSDDRFRRGSKLSRWNVSDEPKNPADYLAFLKTGEPASPLVSKYAIKSRTSSSLSPFKRSFGITDTADVF